MKNTLAMLAIAAFTMVATLVVLQPVGADAEDGEESKTAETIIKVTPVISAPTLEEDDCKVTLKMDKESYATGEKPILTVEFTNNGKEAITKSIDVSMVTRSAFEGGRMPAIARVVWTQKAEVSLAAGETKSVTLETGVEINNAESVSFQMSGKDGGIEADAIRSRRVNG
jgi:hypothetical protein